MYVLKQLHSKAAGPANCSIKCHQDPKNTRNFFCTKRQGNVQNARKLDPQKARKKRKEKTQGNKKARKGRTGCRSDIASSAAEPVDSKTSGTLAHWHIGTLQQCLCFFGRRAGSAEATDKE